MERNQMTRHSVTLKPVQGRRPNLARPSLNKVLRIQDEIICAVHRGDADLADELLCIDLEDAENDLSEPGR
jgi:hypothetical protein